MILVLLPLLFGNTWGVPITSDISSYILGGYPVNISDVPYHVSLDYCDDYKCGGSIISSDWILTAAHCIPTPSPELFSIRAGSSLRNEGGITRAVSEIHKHEEWHENRDFDIAVLRLTESLSFEEDFIEPVSLPMENTDIPDQTLANVSGWGCLHEDDPSLPDELHAVEIPVVDNEKCTEKMGYPLSDSMLCAGYASGGRGSCKGDSGGPLVSDKYGQIGIVSAGIRNSYGIYVSVPYFRSWIKETTGV